MDSNWIRHVSSPEQKAKVKESIKNSSYTLELLKNILIKELETLDTNSIEDYSIPNWDCLQADRNGYKRAVKRFLNLINIKED